MTLLKNVTVRSGDILYRLFHTSCHFHGLRVCEFSSLYLDAMVGVCKVHPYGIEISVLPAK